MADKLVIQIDGDVKDYQDALEKVKGSTKGLERQLTSIAKVSAVAFAGLAAAIGVTTNSFIAYEKALVGVGKTTNIDGKALEEFGNRVQTLSKRIPVATNELLAIAQAAGQLGVRGNENLLAFTETVAKLGVSTDLAGEEAALALTRILTVTNEGTKDIATFGSVIVALGNNFAATESEIVRMTTEVARSTAVFNVSSGEAAAMSAALKSIGVQAQLGGSAMGRAFRTIDAAVRGGGKQLEDLAELTGKTGAELKKTFQEDSVKAFQFFINGLGDISRSGGDTTAALAKFGLKGEEILKVLPVLANNSHVLAKALKIQADESENATALNEEAAKAFGTLDSSIKKMKNSITVLSTQFGERFAKDAGKVIGLIADLADGFSNMDEETKDTIVSFIKWGTILTGTIAAITTFGIVVLKVSAFIGVITAALLPAAVAASSFWVAVTGPIGIAVAGIALVVAGVTALWSALDNKAAPKTIGDVNDQLKIQKDALANVNKEMEGLTGFNKVNIAGYDRRKQAINEEIAKLEELKSQMKSKGKVAVEVDQVEKDIAAAKIEKMKEDMEIKAELRQEEFDTKIEEFEENNQILTELELETLQANLDAKAQMEDLARANKLIAEGKQDEAFDLLEKSKIKRQIKNFKDRDAREKKADKDDEAREKENERKREVFAKAETDLKVATTTATIGIANKTATLLTLIQGKQTKEAFLLSQAAAVASVFLADSQARAAATAASAIASLAAVPGTNAAVFTANMGYYQGLITANTGLSLGIIAAQTVKGFASGGEVMGGIPGVDSVPIMAQQGELVSPTSNFEEVIGSVRAKRAAEDIEGGGGFGGGSMELMVSYDSEEASQIVTIRQNEDTALGISQDSFKEAV